MKTRQEKALEIRDLVKQVNARVAELQEDGCTIRFKGVGMMYEPIQYINGIIDDVKIERLSTL